MNINLITPKFNAGNNYSVQNDRRDSSNYLNGLKLKSLNTDVVSFTANPKKVTQGANTFLDAIGRAYEQDVAGKNKKIAQKLMDTISIVVSEIEGMAFDRAHYEKTALKGKKSFLSKLKRSGAVPLDQIRTTVYSSDIYNLSNLGLFIEKMSERGYEVRKIPGERVSGKITSWKPDLDIRLDDVSADEVKKLPEAFRGCVSDRLPSGLGDIQIRFIDETAKNKKPLEVIFMVGQESGKAKQIEEDDIYSYIRVLKDELHISKNKTSEPKTPLRKVKDSVSYIADTLRGSVSKPLYANAEALDVEGEVLGLPVGITKQTAVVLKGFLDCIRDNIEHHFNNEIAKVRSNEYQKEIERMIKATPEFKEREDKTIYLEDIFAKKNDLVKSLKTQKAEDLETFADVQAGLNRTIRKYTFKD